MNKKFVCPNCQKMLGATSKFFPFCSKRCQQLDLGAWANEEYRVAGLAVAQEQIEIESDHENGETDD
ncbi:MAG: DNA gyrase inhibitor YacG [Bdellovibrionales bacterium]|nr:DNA gyrase inhibitor YacG [Bdellovibrionales bacterium]